MPDGDQQILTNKPLEYSLCVKYLSTTMRYLGEILVVILFVFTSYASLQKGSLKIQSQSPPVPLLNSNATVSDFYGGDIATPFTTVLHSDVSLVMYYAPWDFDSQLAIHDFEKIAKKYKGQVFCSSINCWVSNGACKKTFPKLRSFPLILGYVGGTKGVQYRGPLQYEYLDKFVQSLLKPLKRIETVADLYKLLTQSTAVVTGYFNFDSVKPNGFYSFYLASLRNLEYDAHESIAFAIATNPNAANRLGIHLITTSQQFDVRLHLWNETLIYPHNENTIDVPRFLQWIHYRSHSPIQLIWPSCRKNQLIQHYLIEQQRPSLILFTSTLTPSYQTLMVKEVAFDYNNCAFSLRIARLIEEIQRQRYAMETSRLAAERQCSIFEKERECGLSNTSLYINASITTDSSVEKTCGFSFKPTLFKFQGLGCRTNRSLKFFVINSNQYPNFLINLGYSSKEIRQNANIALIVDPKAESHYIMSQTLSKENLENFIVNYTENSLRRFRRSHQKSKLCPPGRVCLEEISTDEFEKVVLDPSHDAIVFYRKNGCVFCEVGARFFLKLSLMFSLSAASFLENTDLRQIRFATINAEENDLPWQFTVDKYPSIVFYPAYRKSESRLYPHNLELNEANLLNFTLSQLSIKNRVSWFIHFCRDTPCLQEAHRQIDAQIGIIDRQIRVCRNRLLWSIDGDRASMEELRGWVKERHFFKELSYSVRKTVVGILRRMNRDGYPNGVRITAAE
ncbi:thioredoxin domain-containing protein 11-like [Daphnia pulex]|uniref:thioredoxin domain-containing protein 11-like n=1 Tax=Daphnia pulex TaxID=6669 RepID=UPI001EDF8688|nr:thioredoxin domain-containing protein 11-like [Daphnia pulex]